MKRTTLKSLLFALLVVALAGVLVASCTQGGGAAPTPTTQAITTPAGGAPTQPPAGATTPPAGGAVNAQAIYQQNCNSCHPNGAAGVGPALTGLPLTEDQIATQVRQGGGGMPAFPPSQISDAELAALAEYVEGL